MERTERKCACRACAQQPACLSCTSGSTFSRLTSWSPELANNGFKIDLLCWGCHDVSLHWVENEET
eukprot:scaffold236771_cov17-Tisochrysis_lutea.AAC.1